MLWRKIHIVLKYNLNINYSESLSNYIINFKQTNKQIILQSYEWFTMLFIISMQRHATLGEIMFRLNDQNEKNKFVCRERIAFTVSMMACFLIVLVRIHAFLFYTGIIGDENLNSTLLDISELGSIGVMSLIFFTLLINLFRYYRKEL